MNVLKSVETTIANLVEGTFGRLFRSEVRPMEIARKLAREMDEHVTASVSRTYAPNEYAVWLSPQDRARYEGVEHEVIDELCAYLLEHARREELILPSSPIVTFHTDERLALGEFGIQAQLGRASVDDGDEREPARAAAEPPAPARERHGETMIYSNAARIRGGVDQAQGARRSRALVTVAGRRLPIPPRGATLGRSRDCDIVLEDSSISRRHAEIRPAAGDGWTIADLGSTNGVRLNGRTVRGAEPLHAGDRVELGSTEISFELG